MNISRSFMELVGKTPLFEMSKFAGAYGAKATICAKLEMMNPAGSVKDRIAVAMVEDAEAKGLLSPGGVIIEPTSGNTGIGLAAVACARGYRLILTMPETMSVERRKLLAAYGAQLVLTEGALGMQGAVDRALALKDEIAGAVILGQFSNPANVRAHFTTTGPEIYADTDGKVDIFIAGVGTGGTISGVGAYLKSRNANVQVIAVEPASSPVLSKGIAGRHRIQGIGAGFRPEVLDGTVFDEVMTVKDEDAMATGREIARTEGLLVGISSGAAAWAALEVSKRPENEGKLIVAVLPDGGERYLSTEMFNP